MAVLTHVDIDHRISERRVVHHFEIVEGEASLCLEHIRVKAA